MSLRQIAAYILVGVGVLLIFRLAYTEWRFRKVERNFESIQAGQTNDEVIAILGRPNYHTGACLEDLRISNQCSTELVYSHPFAPWVPEYFVVDFAAGERVIGTEHLISP